MQVQYTVAEGFFTNKPIEIIKTPVIVHVKNFTQASASAFASEVASAHTTGQDVIPVVIDSYGGYLHALLHMVDTIKQSELPVATICQGVAMSCGALLLMYGTQDMRYASPRATIMLHDVSAMSWGKLHDVETGAVETRRLSDLIWKEADENCGHKSGYFEKLLHKNHHSNWYLTPEEAKKHGIIKHIGIPAYQVEATLKYSLE